MIYIENSLRWVSIFLLDIPAPISYPIENIIRSIMTEFEQTLDKKEKLNVEYSLNTKLIQANFEKECESAYKIKFPKRKFILKNSLKNNKEEHDAIWNKWNIAFQDIAKSHCEELKVIGEKLNELAKTAEIPVFDGMSIYDNVSSSSYSSMGWGNKKYALFHAKEWEDHAKSYGLNTYIEERLICSGSDSFGYPYSVIDYVVWVSTDDIGVEILKRKPEKGTMVEWIRKCDAACVSPKVFCPFMDYGYIEKLRKEARL